MAARLSGPGYIQRRQQVHFPCLTPGGPVHQCSRKAKRAHLNHFNSGARFMLVALPEHGVRGVLPFPLFSGDAYRVLHVCNWALLGRWLIEQILASRLSRPSRLPRKKKWSDRSPCGFNNAAHILRAPWLAAYRLGKPLETGLEGLGGLGLRQAGGAHAVGR